MNTAVINIKTEVPTKRLAQKVASDLGLSLSALINAYLKELIKTKRVEFSVNETPSPYLINAIKQAEVNYKKGKVPPGFMNAKDPTAWLEDPKATYQNGDKV